MAALEAIGGKKGDELVGRLQRLSPAFARLLIEQTYGEVISRPALSLKDRELATVAILVALGDVPSALELHCVGMLRTGWSPREMTETILLAAVGAGTRSFEASTAIAREVLAKRLDAVDGDAGTSLGSRDRRLAELARTLARGHERSAIAVHLERCLLAGWTREQLVELLMHMTVYAGWPLTLNALQPAAATFERFATER